MTEMENTGAAVTKKQKNIAVFQVVLSAALWSIAGIFIKMIPWNPFVIASLRSLFASIVAFTYIRASKLKLRVNKKSLSSAVALCLTMTLFVTANKLTTSANAIVLQFTSPIFIVVISALFLGKRFERADIVAVLLTMGGISLFFLDQLEGGRLAGNIVALGAGVSFALYYISLGSSGLEERMSAILLANLMTVAVGLPFMVMTRPEFSLQPIMCIIVLGVFQLGIPYILLGKGSEHCPPLACSLLGALEPLLNPVWVFLFDGERPGFYALLGGAVVIITICVWCILSARQDKLAEAAQLESEAGTECRTV